MAPKKHRKEVLTKAGPFLIEEVTPRTPPPKVPDVGIFIRDHLSAYGEDYVSRMHKAFKDAHRNRKEKMREQGVRGWRSGYRVATYHSFLTYCSKLVIIGLLEPSGRVEDYVHPSLGPLKRVYVKLSSKGDAASDYVWGRPLRLWYNPTDEEKRFYPNHTSAVGVKPIKPPLKKVKKVGAVEKVKLVTPERLVAPRKPSKMVTPPLGVLKPSPDKMLTLWSAKEEGDLRTADIRNAFEDIFILAPYYDVTPCTDALEKFQRANPLKDPRGRERAWAGFLDCLRKLAEQEEKEKGGKAKKKITTPKVAPLPPEPSIYTIVESLKAVLMDEEKKAKSINKLDREIGDLTTEQRDLIEGIEDVETTIEEYRDASGAEDKGDAWEGIIEALDAIEVIEEE